MQSDIFCIGCAFLYEKRNHLLTVELVMPGLLDIKPDTLTSRREAVRLALAIERQARHCRLMESTWRKLAQPERTDYYDAQANALEGRVLELHELAKRLPV